MALNRLFEEPEGLPLSKDTASGFSVKAANTTKPAKKSAAKPSATSGPGHVVSVAVNTRVWEPYDYFFPLAMGEPQLGQRVHVPFGKGNRKIVGFIVEIDRPHTSRRLKAIADVIDPTTPLTPGLWELGQWISRYYLSPLGQTLAAMVPSVVGGKPKPRKTTFIRLLVTKGDWPKTIGKNQRVFLDELREAQKQGLDELALDELRRHHPITPASLRSLAAQDLISTEARTTTLDSLGGGKFDDAPFELNEDQTTVCDKFIPALDDGFSVSLLHGVTGSGKTEVYIRAIHKVIAAGKQAILLTPEIALATQTLQRLVTRLPNVAVLHSGLSAAQRAFYWQQIRDGHASVVIGPRSAVFAPTPNTGLIIVDEEHEPTYKQDNEPRYHGRDVAIKRAATENIPVLLGSATPSLESLHNAHLGKYKRLSLPRRVRHLPMPKLQIVNLRKELSRDGKTVELLGRTLTREMAGALDRNEQIILLMNRRGYASYVFCPSCEWTLSCEDC
ncbi:MAG: primosomal protein N', partial [Phycisphaerales bacterium]|nr:primosomal protein N' [Phycisphaerales bacterium]